MSLEQEQDRMRSGNLRPQQSLPYSETDRGLRSHSIHEQKTRTYNKIDGWRYLLSLARIVSQSPALVQIMMFS